jgi:manganese oxidase
MRNMCSMKGRWLITAALLAALSLTGCSGSDVTAALTGDPGTAATVDPGAPAVAVGSPGVSPGTPGATVNPETPVPPSTTANPGTTVAKAIVVTGTVVGDANAALTGASPAGVTPVVVPPPVPMAGPVSVVLVDAANPTSVAVSATVDAANPNFILTPAPGHTYVMLFRKDSPTGPTLSPLIADKQTGRISFSIPEGAADVALGNITYDSLQGKAWSWNAAALTPPAVAFPFTAVEWRGSSDVPTERAPSPLFGAQPFTQQLLLFEEFGPDKYADIVAAVDPTKTLPQPLNRDSGPDPASLEGFLARTGVETLPTRLSNVLLPNPWKAEIDAYLVADGSKPTVSVAPGVVACPIEGRPQGEDWAHQSWDKFPPQKFFKTAQAPARTNGGFRDTKQRHNYGKPGGPEPLAGPTEFGPGGLYNTVYKEAGLVGTTKGVPIQMHPKMPPQDPNSVWTFDGTLPPKLLQARYGEPVMMRHYNALPIHVTANNGFGRHTITTHEHNGHSPGESDGVAGAFFYPGQFYDYRWPLQLAGFSNNNNANGAVNFSATDVRASTPCAAGEQLPVLVNGVRTMQTCQNGLIQLPGDWRETMSTHWFHDHMLDYTSQNVYKGNAVMMNYYSALDRGNEAVSDGVNLRFPSGTALNWGNRDYDVNLVLGDKATDANGQLMMNTDQHNGWLGDMMTVNWLYKPYLDVRARSYRFRILNGSVSRIMALALVQEVAGTGGELPGPAGSNVSYNRVPFHMIANDGNILEHAVPFDGKMDLMHDGNPDAWKGQLPSQTIAERYDIVVNFGKNGIKPNDTLYFVNIMEHQDGKGTKSKVPLADILSERYNPTILNGRWVNGDPGVGKFMELRVKAYAGTDLSMNPVDYEPGNLDMLPLPIVRGLMTGDTTVNGVPVANAVHHTFEYAHSDGNGGHGEPWMIKVDGGQPNTMNPHRVQAIESGDLQVWTIKGTGGWTHPVHIHFEEGIILSRGGKAPPEWEKWGKKDMYRIGPENDSTGIIEFAYRSRDFLGEYVQHCHNTMHEDHAMLLRWDANIKGAKLLDTPMPDWDGVRFDPSLPLDDNAVLGDSNSKAISGDGIGPKTNTRN